METTIDPKDLKNNANDKNITNEDEKIVNKKTENTHEAPSEDEGVNDVNEEFGDDLILPDEKDEVEF